MHLSILFVSTLFTLRLVGISAFHSTPLVHKKIANLKQASDYENNFKALHIARNCSERAKVNEFLPNLHHPPWLTIVVPAYNEEDRIGRTLQSYQEYLANHEVWSNCSCICVVDDGSTDGTARAVREKILTNEEIKIPNIPKIEYISVGDKNQGKGAALSYAIQKVTSLQEMSNDSRQKYQNYFGHIILTTDADGSADMLSNFDPAYEVLVETLVSTDEDCQCIPWHKPALVCGTRIAAASSAPGGQGHRPKLAQNPSLRHITRWGFKTVVRLILSPLSLVGFPSNIVLVDDTQCGFKLYTASAARELFQNLHLLRWSHDVEILFRAMSWSQCQVGQSPVVWRHHKEGSKLEQEGVFRVSLQMLLDVCRLRVMYQTGRWQWRPKV